MQALRSLPLLALLLLAACSGTAEPQPQVTRPAVIAGKFYEHIWSAAIRALTNTRTDRVLDTETAIRITSQDRATGRIEVDTGTGLWEWGERLRFTIVPPHDSPEHRIEVQRLTQAAPQDTPDWERLLLDRIHTEVDNAQARR